MSLLSRSARHSFAPIDTFRTPRYGYLWVSSLLWNMARSMDQVVLGWVVLEMTNSAWDLAVMGALRWLPLLVFGAAGGAVADRLNRRVLLLGAQGLGLSICLGASALLALGVLDVGLAFLITFLLGLQWAVDWPIRRALIPDVVGRERTVNAVALEALTMNLTRIVGPLVAGILVASASASAAFLVMACMYAGELLLLRKLPRTVPDVRRTGGSLMRYLGDGFSQLRQCQPIVGVLAISVLMNVLVFPYQQLLPVFARDVLNVDAVGLGALTAAAGIGSFAGATVIASWGRIPRSGLLFWTGSCFMSLLLVAFSASGDFTLALALVGLSGIGQAAFASLQSTIVLDTASDQLRGRALGALTVAIGSAPFGMLGVGVLAVAVGAPLAVGLSAGACAVLIGVVVSRLPRFRAA